jgi:hypothetical protein
MASGQARGSDHRPQLPRGDGRGSANLDGLTRAEARALSRSTPLTPAEFRARRRLAEQRMVPLRGVLDGMGDTPRGEDPKRS